MSSFKNEVIKGSTDKKLRTLNENIVKHLAEIEPEMSKFYGKKPKYTVFLSIGDKTTRAYVAHGSGNDIEASWKNALTKLKKLALDNNVRPIWVKADIVREIKEYTYEEFIEYVTSIKKNYFREGISFDPMFNLAFLEQEVNANVFLHQPDEQSEVKFKLKNINTYLKNMRGVKHTFTENSIQHVYTFKTISYFHDESSCFELESELLSNGRRKVGHMDKEFLQAIIDNSSRFLAKQVGTSGKFRYGFFPCFNKEIDFYNILRHASTTYSMVEAYEITRDPQLGKAIRAAIKYLLKEGMARIRMNGTVRAFIIEKVNDNEIKLGANAHAILALAKYTKVFKDDQCVPIMQELAEGILYFQNKRNGSFVHVLNYPDLSLKDKFRTIYYDGEATFALMRLYEIDKNEKWLQTVEKAFDYFIEAKHWQIGDHWLSYCSNELVKYKPERKYVDFNLKNASGKLDFCLERETTYPTLLELLMASYNMIKNIKSQGLYPDLIESFDEEKLMRAIEHRVNHQLNGYFWPEFAMYFAEPQNILWSFYIRHHSFRVRIDDIEHNISGYCNYYHNILSEGN